MTNTKPLSFVSDSYAHKLSWKTITPAETMTITNIISSHNSGTRRSRKIRKRSSYKKMQNRLIFMTICITSNFGNGGILFKRLSIFIIRSLFKIRLMLKYYKSSNNIFNKMDIIDYRWLLGQCWSKRYDLKYFNFCC